MDTKIDATPNRPKGERVTDAPTVTIDTATYIHQLKMEKAWEKNDRNAITVFKIPGVTIVLAALHKSAALADFSVEALLTIQVLEGSIEITHENEMSQLSVNHTMVLQSTASVSIQAVTDAIMQLTYIELHAAHKDSVI